MSETLNPETGELTADTPAGLATGDTLTDEQLGQIREMQDAAEAEGVTEPAETDNQAEMRKAGEKLANEAERHKKRIDEIMGEDVAGLVPCELCPPNIPGWRFDVSPTEETTARVRVAIGMPDLTNFRPSATERVCDDCAGLGKVRTGSTVPQYETATCDACAGKGFVASRPRLNEDSAPPEPAPVVNGEQPVYDDGIRRDMFGTPETDPDYGKMPNMRTRPVDYWQTHRT